MAASVIAELPTCLCHENSRLVSLWDIVNLFDAPKLLIALQTISSTQGQLSILVRMGQGNQRPDEVHYQKVIEQLTYLRDVCHASGLEDSRIVINLALGRLNDPRGTDSSSISAGLTHVCESVIREGGKRYYLQVLPDRVEYLEQSTLFGFEVALAFPSAMRDVQDAGNALAAECCTAAVFHVMRAAEVALRALALDRQVQYPDASLSSKQVGDLLSALDGKMADMRKADAKLWPSRDIKDAQINFYHRAIVEFRDFNEAWRKHMAHAHEGANYDRDAAKSILGHVRGLMIVLAEKISESGVTPLYWTSV